MKVNYDYLKNHFPYSIDGLEAMIVCFFYRKSHICVSFCCLHFVWLDYNKL